MKCITTIVQTMLTILIAIITCSNQCFAQSVGDVFSRNVSLLSRNTYNGPGGANDFALWSKNGKSYVVVTRLDGVSIIDVTDPKRPSEVVYFELTWGLLHSWVVDVSIYQTNNRSYAYLNNERVQWSPYVVIMDLDTAITYSGHLSRNVQASPLVSPLVSSIINPTPLSGKYQSHTLFVAGTDQDNSYLYVCTQDEMKLMIYKLNPSTGAADTTNKKVIDFAPVSSPVSVPFCDSCTAVEGKTETYTKDRASVHEVYVKAQSSSVHKVYAAITRGGAEVFDISLCDTCTPYNVKKQIYDFDRRYHQTQSSDNLFDWRVCHSAYPFNTGSSNYVITTDELSPADVVYPISKATNDTLQGAYLRTFREDSLGSSNSLRDAIYYSQESVSEIGDIPQASLKTPSSSDVPNSIHTIEVTGNVGHCAYYTQGYRFVDLSRIGNSAIIPLGYFDDTEKSDSTYNIDLKWASGINSTHTDPNKIDYQYGAGYPHAFYTMRTYNDVLSDTIYMTFPQPRVYIGPVPDLYGGDGNGTNLTNYSRTFTVTRDVYIPDSAKVTFLSNTTFNFNAGKTIYVNGELQLNNNTFNANSRIVCRSGGKIIICPKANVTGLHTLIVEQGGTLEVKDSAIVKIASNGIIKIHGIMSANLPASKWAYFNRAVDSLEWKGIVFDSTGTGASSNSVLRHISIRGAHEGIKTDSAQVTIDSCSLMKNYIGITINRDSPFFTYNRVDSNTFAGLVGYYMSTVVSHNRFNKNNIGAQLYHCGNLWQDNRLDSNSTGVLGYEALTIPFNRWLTSPSQYTCDTANGNSMRYNQSGVALWDLCAPTFECDNSVHGNTSWDVTLIDNIELHGWGNYPDSVFMSWNLGNKTKVQWNPADTLNHDPVLRKSGTKNNLATNPTVLSDSRYTQALNLALAHCSIGEYSNAVIFFKEAIRYVRQRWEAEQCLVHWQQTFIDAKMNKLSNDPISLGSVAAAFDFINQLTSLQSSADSTWLRNTASEVLASEYMRRSQFNSALPLYQELSSKTLSEPILARRAMTSLVILFHRGLGDYESALKVHDQIAELYPHSRALVFAKVDLGLPLTDEEMKLMSDTTRLSKENSLTEKNTQTNDVVTKEYVLYQSFPNPSNPSTTIRYEIPVDSKIHLAVYSSLGKLMATLVDREERQGVHLVEFDGSLLSSGTYMYKLRAEDLKSGEVKVLERKMMLLK